jgi:hypothetical protein
MMQIIRRIVAMSKWWYPYTLTPEQEAARVGVDKLPDSYLAGTLIELTNEFLGKLFEGRRKYLDHTKDYCMLFFLIPNTPSEL